MPFGDLIFAYTRAEAIEDGTLVACPDNVSQEAGIKFPVALTHAVWRRYVEFDPAATGQDQTRRLWDILWTLRSAARGADGPGVLFQLHVAMPDRGDWLPNEAVPARGSGLSRSTHRLVTLRGHCGPGDNAEPVITILLPNED